MKYAVIGTFFGDEGKGNMVNSLASYGKKETLVCRFNGGAQAGHTVVTEKARHIFHHFGSGTFQESPTLLSRFFVCHPMIFRDEHTELRSAGTLPRVYVDARAFVTTPYDMLINQLIEDTMRPNHHGSCGIGFGETILREHRGYRFSVFDLIQAHYTTLIAIREHYVPLRLTELKLWPPPEHIKILLESNDLLEHYVEDCRFFQEHAERIVDRDLIDSYKHVVFEGAQGRLLGEDVREYAPHISWSHTGVRNIQTILEDDHLNNVEVIYVMRPYLTRHGRGPLPYEILEVPYVNVTDKTNVDNHYQGPVRYAFFQEDLLKKSLSYEKPDRLKEVKLALTCFDHLGDKFTFYKASGRETSIDKSETIKAIENTPQLKVGYIGVSNRTILAL